MTTTEHQLIAKTLETGDPRPIHAYRITAEHFVTDPAMGEIWTWICRYTDRYKKVPSKEAFNRAHGGFHIPNVRNESLDALCDEVIASYTDEIWRQGLESASKLYEQGDIKSLTVEIDETSKRAREVTTSLASVDLTESGLQRIDDYLERAEHSGSLVIPGAIPTGFHGLDRITGGYQPGQFIVYTGVPKAGKTILLLISALAAHRHGVASQFFTFEMSVKEIGYRWDGLISGLSSSKIMRGRLNKPETTQYREAVKHMKGFQPFILSQDYIHGATISSIKASLQKYAPKALFVDGIYMMTTEKFIPNQAERMSQIVSELKSIANDYAIPVIATTQSLHSKTGSGGRLNANSPGYTSAFTQYADALIGVEKHADIDQMSMVRVLVGRTVRADIEFGIHWDWEASNFTEVDDDRDEDDD